MYDWNFLFWLSLELPETIPESANRVGIYTLRKTIPELSRF